MSILSIFNRKPKVKGASPKGSAFSSAVKGASPKGSAVIGVSPKVSAKVKISSIPIHITPRGVRYVHTKDILNSASGKAIIKKFAKKELSKAS